MKIRKENFKDWMLFCTVDIETWENNTVRLIGFTDENELYFSFSNMKDFLKFLSETNLKKRDVFAHYGGGFDFLIAIRYILDNMNVEFADIYDSSGLLIYICFKFSNGVVIHLRDSYALFRTSLNNVSEKLIGEKKLDIDIENRDNVNYLDLNDYCEKDNYLLRRCLNKYREIINDDFAISISSQAMRNFCTYHLSAKNQWSVTTKFHDEKLRQWYAGGRVDVFRRYGKNISYYDVNNMYGYIMQKFGSPVGIGKNVKNRGTDCIGFYNIIFEKLYDIYNPFCWIKFNNKLMFINSVEKVFKVTSHELKILDENNLKYRIINGVEFDYDVDFFKSYFNFWNKKLKENFDHKFIIKLLLNSLYGKYGEKRIKNKIIIGKSNLKYYIDEVNLIGYQEEYKATDYSNVQIAAWITSGARCLLYEYMRNYKDNLFYCDTDSIFTDCAIDEKHISEKEVGKLKLEGSYKEAIFLSQKMYALKNDNYEKVVFKGFDTENFNFEMFKHAYNDQTNLIERKKRFMKAKSFLKSRQDKLDMIEVTKKVSDFEIKRKMLDDNINTKAFTVHNNQLI
jgi:hypothetical protein